MVQKKENQIGTAYKDFTKTKHPILFESDKSWVPSADIFESDSEFVLILDISSVDPKKIDILIEAGYLVVKGIRKESAKHKKRHYHTMEIDYGPFERRFELPVALDKKNIISKYNDGFLEINLKKIEDRRIEKTTLNIDWQE